MRTLYGLRDRRRYHSSRAWKTETPGFTTSPYFWAGFILGMTGTYIAAWMYGYRQTA